MNFCLDARTAEGHFPGIGRYVTNLAQALAHQLGEHETLMIVQRPAVRSGCELPAAQPDRVTLVDCGASPFGLGQQFAIPRLLREKMVEVYHSPYYLMPYRPGVPTVVTIYDLIPHRFPQYVSGRARWLFGVTTWLALRVSRRVICISETTRQDLLSRFRLPPGQVEVIPLAPDPMFSPRTEVEARRVRGKFGLPERFGLYVGSNKPHKNLERLVEAWARVATDAPLVIAGVWDERYPEVKSRVTELGLERRVLLLGTVLNKDLPDLYSAATVFVFPSLYEGFGLPVIEAMACGTAVACANTSSLLEVAGEAAVLFDPTRTEAIAQAVTELWEDSGKRGRLQERGLAQAKKFTWAQTARKTLQVYRTLP